MPAAADGVALDRAIGRFLQERQAPASQRRVIAVDGKTLRGSRAPRRPATTPIAAMTHGGRVLGQRQVGGESDGIRRLKTAAFAHPDRPRACQVLQVVRWRGDMGPAS
ncbi:hypothetical protein ACFY0A_05140 [Streptomyces sp. NPDC001698]|uniref:hypothetical protein n=1 Tax=Streptomyces sp. NPDC001698 TaxID=3364601 RepID=UPI003696CC77